jgi:thioredoxin reductase
MADNSFEVIIVGGSYAGLSAAMSLGRSIRKVLVIDSGEPCNRHTPRSHNFITHDGEKPADIAHKAKEQVMKYPTISFMKGTVVDATRDNGRFTVYTSKGAVFSAQKLLFTTGVSDQMPAIEGLSACWGISVLHCPYCHGYEVRNAATAVLANGDAAYHVCTLLTNWTSDIVLLTNGDPSLTAIQKEVIGRFNISVIDKKITGLVHKSGQLEQVRFDNGSRLPVSVMYAKLPFTQHCDVPEKLGCRFTAHGHIFIDDAYRTTIPGVYAAGDNTTIARILSAAVGAGTTAGITINTDLLLEGL